MSISAANIAPNFLIRLSITAEELQELQEPAVIFEYAGSDSDGEPYFVYTVAGWLHGQNIATEQGGCTVGGQVIIINARNREDADAMAADGLGITCNGLDEEDRQAEEAQAALSRLRAVGAVERIRQAARGDKNERFVADAHAIQKLRGDDVVLAAGRMASPAGLKSMFPTLH